MTFQDSSIDPGLDDVFQESPAARADLFKALDWCLALDVTAAEKVVMVYLARMAHPRGFCWPSQGRIAADTGLSLRTVEYSIKALRVAGHISVSRRGKAKKLNEYVPAFYRDRIPPGKLAGF